MNRSAPDLAARIAENLAEVQGRIAAAAGRAGRQAQEITLIGVTKYVGPPEIRALVEAGCHNLGESRPQQIWERAVALAGLPIRWHMIGHLQRNKVRRTVPLVAMIQSVDSLRLAAEISEAVGTVESDPATTVRGDCPDFCAPTGHDRQMVGGSTKMGPSPLHDTETWTGRTRVPVLLEVNVSGETAKHGFAPDQIEAALIELAGHCRLEVRGLMCMAGLEGGLDVARRQFASLRCLRDRLRQQCPGEVRLNELSMGMSGDYEAAIEEGATMVRVGSALFEGVMP
jgi:PLP dependent protein